MTNFENQEEFMKVSSFREFQPARFFIEFVDFNKFRLASYYASSFKLDFSITLHSCCEQLSHMISAYSNREHIRGTFFMFIER